MTRLSLLLMISLLFSSGLLAENGASVVIVHPQVAQSAIDRQQLRRIFLLKQRTWDDGAPISLVVFASDDDKHRAFLRQRLNMFPYQLEREWNKLIYSGQSAPPAIATDTENMLRLVASTPGAIGYVLAPQAIESSVNQVKVIEVIEQ